MSLLDRYIFARFLVNFALLFSLLCLFAATIDVVLNLDEFVDVANDGDDAPETIVGLVFRIVTLAVGAEINVDTDGDDVGEGAIGLLGASVSYGF